MGGQLLPCPFCGSRFKMGQEPRDNFPFEGKFYLYHDYGPIGSKARECRLEVNGHFDTEVAAVSFWNGRQS